MPNIITHVLFAQDTRDEIDAELKDLIVSREQLFEVGANGADFLFFHKATPKNASSKSALRTLGTQVHKHGINDFYKMCLQRIRAEKDPQVKQDEIVYCLGHLTHWALDSTAHPYIFYRTGSGNTKAKLSHHKMESLLDSIVLKVKRDQTIETFQSYKICDVDIDDVRAIARIYVPVAREVYDIQIQPHQILESLNDWYTDQKILYDGNDTKLNAFLSIEELIRSPGLVSAMIVPNYTDDPCDICNLLHKKWVNPCDNTIESEESFFDLYDCAKELAKEILPMFVQAIDSSDKEKELYEILGNRSYTRGLPNMDKMQYFDPDIEHVQTVLLKKQK